MTKIRIKKGKSSERVSDDLRVDLRNQPVETKQPSNKWLFLSIFLFIIVLALSAGWYLSIFQKSNLIDLVPKQAIAFSLINQQALYDQVFPFNYTAINKATGYLNQVDLDFKDIDLFFKQEIAFILMPDNSEAPLPFLLVLEEKRSLDKLDQVLDKIELRLKQDYNVSFNTYRQSRIVFLEPLLGDSAADSYVYAQTDKYFIISNSYQSLVLMVDLVINN